MSELEGIAIVGIAARFPGAHNAEELWRNLRDGIESVTFFTEEELAAAGVDVDPALLADPRYVRAKGVLDGADLFDAAFFGFTPREAEAMDPQHRVFLECAWEALEDAACDPEHPAGHSGRIGVWAGSGASSYLISNLLPNQDRLERFGSLQVLLLNDRDFLATRASYELNLRGPSVSVQTACSTSLVAVHMACQSLLGGECDMALAGGVSISSPLRTGYLYQEGGVMSPDGRCRAFDAAASGAVEGNGCGVVALKRLADAVADGDRVYAVIRGSAVNNDGSAKVGFTAPSVEGQAEVISEALMMSGVEPETIGYVEAHGSGTPLGDPIEVAALTQAFHAADTAGARGPGFCGLGSVKTSFGHCNTAAGVAGLIKTALALTHRTLPPSLHYETPNPQIDFAASPFQVVTEARPWDSDGPRRAGVSSFGLGGTNAHAVLEEAPETEPGDRSTRPAQLLVVSARTPAALDAATARLADHLDARPDQELADVAWTLQTGRKAFEHRRIVVARDRSALRGPAVSGTGKGQGKAPVVFLFPGLGDQRVDMARELYEAEPFFREQVDLCAEKLAPWLGADLREVLFSPGEQRPKVEKPKLLRAPAEPSRLDRTEFAQPACFVVEYALGRLLMEWGIEPQALIGYSLGEYVAACLSGALSLDDALELVARRAKLIQELPEGAMLAVPLPEDEVRALLGDGIDLSATNGPHFCVVGGPGEKIDELDRRLAGRGVTCLRLRATHAFHTGMMEPAMAGVKAMARPMRAPSIPFVSNVTGTWITAADLADPGYWARHMRSPVRFAEGIGELLQEPGRVFLEAGPGATLGTLVKQHPAVTATSADRVTIPALREGADLDAVLEAVGRLWIAGVEVDWQRFHNGERRLRVPLPTYPFERQRYWIDPPKTDALPSRPVADPAGWLWVPAWKQVPRTGTPKTGRWLVFLDEAGLGERIVARLQAEGHEVATVRKGDGFDLHGGADFVLHLWSLTRDEPTFEEAQGAGLISVTQLAQALPSEARLLVVANGLHELVDGDPVHPGKGTLLGALKVVHQEVPKLEIGSVDVVLGDLDRLAGQLLAELSGPLETAVALRGRQRWVRGFEPVRGEDSPSRLVRGGVYLIAEAAHGPGMAIADHLVRDLDAKVALVLPPQLPPRERWETWTGLPGVPPGQDAIGAAILRLLALEREVGLDRVLILDRLDISTVRERFGPIHGAFYTGIAAGGGLLQLKTPESLHATLDPMARSVEAFLSAVDEDRPAFILLSSTTPAVTGSLGQLEVAAAGSYLDAVAARRAADGKPCTLTAHWDPYQWGGWLVTGVAGGMSGLAPEEVEASLRAYGVTEAKSAAALERLLAAPYPRVIVSSQNLHGLLAEIDSVTADTLLAQMAAHHGHHGEKAPRPGLPTPFEPPRDELEERLAAVWQDLFGIEPIGRDDSFLELGGHSLLAIQMVTQIRAVLEVDLPVTALFESPTIAELAKSVRRARGEEDAADLEALLALVEGLSPEEAAAKLAELEMPAVRTPPPVPPVSGSTGVGDWPLSFDQERLWRMHQDDPALVSWNVDAGSRVRGELDIPVFLAAFRELIRRHAAWRTAFPILHGQPVQRVHPWLEPHVSFVDVSALPGEIREQAGHAAIYEHTRTPFNLQQGPLVRMALVRLAPGDHLYLLTIHHTVTDWITFQIFFAELMQLYEAFRAGQPSPLPAPLQFPDYAVWERDWFQGEVFEDEARFWRRELEGFPLVLDLPADRPRPPIQSQRGGLFRVQVGAERTDRLRALARREGLTMFMAVLSVLYALVWRLTGREKIVAGSNSANRPRPELAAVAGLFLTQVPFATDLSGDPTFRELLARTKKTALAAYPHQNVPFTRLIEALGVKDDRARNPVVQVLLLILEGQSHGRTGDLEFEPVGLYDGNSRWDLMFGLYDYHDEGLSGALEYNADIFEEATVAGFLELFHRLIDAVTADPEVRLSRLPESL